MCIVGFIETRASHSAEQLRLNAFAMARTLRHRGPDDEEVWADPLAGVALGFERLAILDFSPAGRQPMESASGRCVIVFNGEILITKRD